MSVIRLYFSIALLMTAVMFFSVVPLPAGADEMEAVLQGPKSVKPVKDTGDTVLMEEADTTESPEGEQTETKSWFSRAISAVGGFFKSVFTSVTSLFRTKPRYRGTGRVEATIGLVMRDGPGTENTRIGALSPGTEVQVLDAKDGWFHIKYNGRKAWVNARYVSIEGQDRGGDAAGGLDEAGERAVDRAEKGYVNLPVGLNVRSGPGKDNKRIFTLKSGSVVSILEKKDGWYRVHTESVEGWVFGKCITPGEPPVNQYTGSLSPDESVYLDVPKRTQYEKANGEYQESWCGPTTLGMVYEYHGRLESTRDIAERIYDFETRNGTDPNAIIKDAKIHGFPNSVIRTGVDLDFLQDELESGHPVIVGVEVAWQSGHYMVVVGMEGDKIIVNDPGRTNVRREFNRSWFLTQWNGRWRRAIVLRK